MTAVSVFSQEAFRPRRSSERGLASIEAVPLIVLFVLLASYALGFWGAVHTAIHNSMASRSYAFETFRNRSHLTMHRDLSGTSEVLSNAKLGIRFHSIKSENASNGQLWPATTRPLTRGFPGPKPVGRDDDHNRRIYEIGPRNRNVEVSPMWIMVGYGICLNAQCGDP